MKPRVFLAQEEIRKRASDLEETLRQAHQYETFYRELLGDWFVLIHALKYAKDPYPWERMIEIEEEKSLIEAKLPNVSDDEFDKYVVLWDLLGVLYEEV